MSIERIRDKRRDMLCIVRPKACKRCGGDLSLECDVYGVYIECIQCGANWTRKDLTLATIRDAAKSLKAVKAKPLMTTGRQGRT
jgi:hypothetical protein